MNMEATSAGSRVGRSRWTPGQLWQVPTFIVGLVAFLAVAASAPIRHPSEYRQFDSILYDLRQGLLKHQEPTSLLPLVDTVLGQVYDFADRAGEVDFLAGSVYYRLALARGPERAREDYTRAVEYFELALQHGVDDTDVPTLEYRLGWSLHAQDRDTARALELIARSIDRGADEPLAGYQLLLRAYLKMPSPDLDLAIGASRKVIELTDDRNVEALAQARIAHAELLLRKDQRGDAIKELDRVSAKASRELKLRARLLQVDACEHEGLWAKAQAVWQELLPDADKVQGGKARVLYAIGLCSELRELPDLARAAKTWQEALTLGGPEGQAAGLRLGRIRLLGQTLDAQGLEDWRQALAALKGPADYRNPYLELTDVRAMFEQALTLFQDMQDYDKMRVVAELYTKVAPAGQAHEKLAHAAEAQAIKLQKETEAPAEEVRQSFFRAAEAYESAAQSRSKDQAFDALWHSASCFLLARNAGRAAEVLTQLEKLDQQDIRLAEGWYLLGELQREGKGRESALTAYYRSMQYAATPYAARSRYQVALAAADKKEWDKAENTLKPNLQAAVDREAHENSLYEMASVQMNKANYDRASYFLNMATGLYPNNPQALLLRGDLAQCYRRFADVFNQRVGEQRQLLRSPGLSDEQKFELEEHVRHFQQLQRQNLQEAMNVYQGIVDEVRNRESRQKKLSALDATLGLRAVLSLAECHQDRGEYLQSLRLYKALLERNRARVESLIAYKRIIQLKDLTISTDLLPAQGQHEVLLAARLALELAEKDLIQMRSTDSDFQGTSVWSREQWMRELANDRARMNAPPPAPPAGRPTIFQ
jgi:tetratricopeptide (TPR) repeat protein